MTFEVGQVCEMRWRDEGGDRWLRVRVVEVNDRAVWVKHADRIGNSFPVPREYLRPPSPAPETRDDTRDGGV